MKCILAVCSDTVSLDKATNSVSLFGIVDGISALTFPHSLPNLAMLFIVKKEGNEAEKGVGHAALTFRPNDEQAEIEKGQVPVNFDFEGKQRLRVLIRSGGITVEEPGTLISRLWNKDILMGEWSIDVTQKQELPAQNV
jgi:hypothetical protein